MTREDIAKLSEEEANIAIAIAQGFEIGFGEIINVEPDRDGEPIIVDHRPIPSYCSDLNACTKFQENASSNYWHQLADDIGCRQYGSDILQAFRLIGIATARQRVEAFLATTQRTAA